MLVRYISVMEMAPSVMNIPSTESSYVFTDIFVGLPDARRKYIDGRGSVRRTTSEGGKFYQAYLARSASTGNETYVEWCEKYDEGGAILRKDVLQKVHIPAVSKNWHVDRIARYAILKYCPHTVRPSHEGSGFVALGAQLKLPLNGHESVDESEFIGNLERWWRGLYEEWLTSIGHRRGWKSERAFEMAAQAFDLWRYKRSSQ